MKCLQRLKSSGLPGITIIIKKKICSMPIFHIEWKHWVLYNSTSKVATLKYLHTHTPTPLTDDRERDGCEKTGRLETVFEKVDFTRDFEG